MQFFPINSLITQAKREFEAAGRSMFESTINLGKQLRPKASWGFYGFPDCYSKKENRYQCSSEVSHLLFLLFYLYGVQRKDTSKVIEKAPHTARS